jgi:histidinol dehydrogenase
MSFAGNAQDRVKNRAENKANQRVDQKVDQAVDKAADAIEGLFRRKKQDQPETPTEEGEVL